MAGDEGSAAALPSVDEMKARLAELVEQHGEGSEPVVAYQAQLDAHPDNQGNAYAPGMAPDPAAEQTTGVQQAPAEASQE